MKITLAEVERIAKIRTNLEMFKQSGQDVSRWEAVFFLRIIDRITL